MRPLPARPVHVREARTSRAAASSDAEKIADRRVRHCGRGGELVDAVVGSLVDPQ
jgi:hypothetical protein